MGKYQENRFLFRELVSQESEHFEILKIKGCFQVLVGCCHKLLTFVANFQLGNIQVIQWLFYQALQF